MKYTTSYNKHEWINAIKKKKSNFLLTPTPKKAGVCVWER